MSRNMKQLLTVLGVILPAVFTYLSARAGSDEAKIRAEVAYVTLQGSVQELQAASYAQALQLAELRGRMDAKASFMRQPASEPGQAATASPTGKFLQKFAAPPSFDNAIEQYKAKK